MHSQHTLYGHLAEAFVLILGRADLNKTSTAGLLTLPRRRSLPVKLTVALCYAQEIRKAHQPYGLTFAIF